MLNDKHVNDHMELNDEFYHERRLKNDRLSIVKPFR